MKKYNQELKDDIYLEVAHNISKLSKDENTQIGAVIVTKEGAPVSWGYNGTVSGFRDDVIPHSREEKKLRYMEDYKYVDLQEHKYPFMCHAEENALDFANNDKLKGATIYVTAMPCGICARQIAKKKLARVVVSPTPKNIAENSIVGRDDILVKFIFAEARISLFIGNKEIFLDKDELL